MKTAYWRRRGGKWQRPKLNKRLTLETLKRKESEVELEIAELRGTIEKIKQEAEMYNKTASFISGKVRELETEKQAVIDAGRGPTNALFAAFRKMRLSDGQKNRLAQLDSRIADFRASNGHRDETHKFNYIYSKIENRQDLLGQIKHALVAGERKAEREKEIKEKRQSHQKYLASELSRARAIAETETSKIRKQAQQKRDRIERASSCPYCGQSLAGREVHLDHIYPVSKGGRSLEANMVYVCAECNSKKKDLTLGVFIEQHNLNYSLICERLSSLGKEW